ncbi:hypothetical protein, partial [Paraburkholderia sediminicola]|uniref:hypothetical protein n=1 Tax=Paraburkholderia sediminicola TaxID=458836 RepID=UPI0038BDC067
QFKKRHQNQNHKKKRKTGKKSHFTTSSKNQSNTWLLAPFPSRTVLRLRSAPGSLWRTHANI